MIYSPEHRNVNSLYKLHFWNFVCCMNVWKCKTVHKNNGWKFCMSVTPTSSAEKMQTSQTSQQVS